MTTPRLLTLSFLIAVLASVPAWAQERLFRFDGGSITEFNTGPGEWGAVKGVLRPTESLSGPIPLPGGRFLASLTFTEASNSLELSLIDLRTGAITGTGNRFGCREFDPRCIALILASDPRTPRLYIRNGDRIAVVTAAGVSYLNYTISSILSASTVAQTPAGPVLLLGTEHGIDVIDVTSGNLARTLAGSSGGAFAVNRAGTRLYAANLSTPSGDTSNVQLIDLATWSVVASRPIQTNFSDFVLLDEQRHRVIVKAFPRESEPATFAVLDSDTLAVATVVPESALSGAGPGAAINTNQPVFMLNGREDGYYLVTRRKVALAPGGLSRCDHHALTRLDTNSGAVLARKDLLPIVGGCSVGYWFEVKTPAPPTLSADVQGRTVTISWSDPGNATHFDFEAGSAPGLRNLVVTSTTGTSFTAAGVPPGTYYLRVRAINEIGRSAPSQELRLTVP